MIEQLKKLIQAGIDRIRDRLTPQPNRAPALAPVRSNSPAPRRR